MIEQNIKGSSLCRVLLKFLVNFKLEFETCMLGEWFWDSKWRAMSTRLVDETEHFQHFCTIVNISWFLNFISPSRQETERSGQENSILQNYTILNPVWFTTVGIDVSLNTIHTTILLKNWTRPTVYNFVSLQNLSKIPCMALLGIDEPLSTIHSLSRMNF